MKSGKGRKAVQTEVEDSVTEEDLVKLCARLRSVKVIHLEEPAFNSLRRRQIGCLSDLPLHTLSITGRPESPFNASTVAQLLLTLPHLKHVALRHVHFFPGAFESLGALPTALSTFSLFSSDVVSAKQLYWLLRTTINNETLSSLALDIPANFRPSLLYPVRWAPVRTTKICCTSDQAGAIENLPLHCPSLQHFTFRTSRQLDPQRLLSACKPFDTVTDLVDASDEGCGLSSLDLAAALAFGFEQATSIRRISLIKSKQWEEGSPLLRAACRARGFEMCYRDFLGEGREFEARLPFHSSPSLVQAC